MFCNLFKRFCKENPVYQIVVTDKNGNPTLDCLLSEAILLHKMNNPGKPYEISGADCVVKIEEVS